MAAQHDRPVFDHARYVRDRIAGFRFRLERHAEDGAGLGVKGNHSVVSRSILKGSVLAAVIIDLVVGRFLRNRILINGSKSSHGLLPMAESDVSMLHVHQDHCGLSSEFAAALQGAALKLCLRRGWQLIADLFAVSKRDLPLNRANAM